MAETVVGGAYLDSDGKTWRNSKGVKIGNPFVSLEDSEILSPEKEPTTKEPEYGSETPEVEEKDKPMVSQITGKKATGASRRGYAKGKGK